MVVYKSLYYNRIHEERKLQEFHNAPLALDIIMDSQKVDMFIVTKGDMFPAEQLPYIRERLANLPDDKSSMMYSVEYKNPTISLVLSLLLGGYGIDRFYIGDIGIGVGKLLTCGGLGIWAIIDWFLIRDATKKANFEKFLQVMTVYGG